MTREKTSLEEVKRIFHSGIIITFLCGILVGVILGAWWGISEMSPTYCYYEYGHITLETGGNLAYYVHFVNLDGDKRQVALVDEPQGSGDTIKLRWCWIPSLENFRARGAWRE